ncbi:hypothetical protein BST61_g8661 [Cercospora zeina]
MPSFKRVAVAATAALLWGTSLAAPTIFQSESSYQHEEWKRDLPPQDQIDELEPVVPPEINESLLPILAPAANVSLAFAGAGVDSSPSAPKRRLMRRAGATFARATLAFRYPAVPLDHSNHVSGIQCANGVLSGTLDATAYKYAKQRWVPISTNMVFVTAADTCGPDDMNDYFHAISVTFNDATRSFTAVRSPNEDPALIKRGRFVWGELGAAQVKRTVTKRDMFEDAVLVRRWESDPFGWNKYLHNDDYLGTDASAPWPNAALLKQWKKGDPETESMKTDDSFKKGEVANKTTGRSKRWQDDTSLTARKTETNFDYSLAIYCVNCGTMGNFKVSGVIDYDYSIIPPSFEITEASAGLSGNMQFELNLGINAYVTYSKTYESKALEFPIYTLGIGGVAYFAPYFKTHLEAGFSIDASGQLLLGGGLYWDNIEFKVDLANSDNTYARGLKPRFEKRAEAKGELHIGAFVGLPIEIGLGLFIKALGTTLWTASAGIRDTPKLNFEGDFEIAAAYNATTGKIDTEVSEGCFGLTWSIFFTNELDAFAEAKYLGGFTKALIDPPTKIPLLGGCIGYVQDGTDDGLPSGKVDGPGSGSGMTGNGMNEASNGMTGSFGGFGDAEPEPEAESPAATTTTRTTTGRSTTTTGRSSTTTARASSTTTARTTSSGPKCTPTPTAVSSPSSSLTCKKTVEGSVVMVNGVPVFGAADTVSRVELCAAMCLKDSKCMSFSYNSKKFCQLYLISYKDMKRGKTSNPTAPSLTYYDKGCWKMSKC